MRIPMPFPRTRDQSGAARPTLRGLRWLLLPLILAIVAAVVFWWLPSRLAPATTTSTATVSQADLTITVSGSGSVAAARTVELPFQQEGTITAVNVQVGDT